MSVVNKIKANLKKFIPASMKKRYGHSKRRRRR